MYSQLHTWLTSLCLWLTVDFIMQLLVDGFQHEQPDYWLNFGNPWEIERLNVMYTIKFYGHVSVVDHGGRQTFNWIPGESVYTYFLVSPFSVYHNLILTSSLGSLNDLIGYTLGHGQQESAISSRCALQTDHITTTLTLCRDYYLIRFPSMFMVLHCKI